MKRRSFLKAIPAVGIPIALNGISFKVLSGQRFLQTMAASCPNDRVLIILQLEGGNDGLNAVIPVHDYDAYYEARANIAIANKGTRGYIALDTTLPDAQKVGLHPDMLGMKQLYDQGKSVILQGVSYPNSNESHFRGRDILFMGGGADDYLDSGWVGRYLTDYVSDNFPGESYPADFPNTAMEDPLALEFGNTVSLIFDQHGNIPASISISNPEQFFSLVEGLEGFKDRGTVDERGIPPDVLSKTRYTEQINWILGLEQKTTQYDKRLKDVYEQGLASDPKTVYPTTYPFDAPIGSLNNPLSAQLQIIANLMSGGCKTKVYLIRMGGFDTHAEQVTNYDASMGHHAALLYHISSAMKAFQDDLKGRGLEERVLTITTSEFGRRIRSNGSLGTDHGAAAPVFIFGKQVNGGVFGNNPLYNRAIDDNGGNIEMQYDYRQIYASIMKDWMCVDPQKVDDEMGVLWGDYTGRTSILPIINNNITSVNQFVKDRFKLNNCYPNPANDFTTISFYVNNNDLINISICNLEGKVLKQVFKGGLGLGDQKILVDLRDLKPGMYFYRIKSGMLDDTKKLTIIR